MPCFGAIAVLASAGLPARAQAPVAPQADNSAADVDAAIIVRGLRGSAIADIAPIAQIDADALAAIGATNMEELQRAIQGQTRSADGSEPIFLLNAQRVAGYQEIGSLPPEAIERVEVLPEPAALRFGYPPTRRVVNFITKRRFSQVEAKAAAGSSVPTGRGMQSARAGYTRLRGSGRLTANLEFNRSGALLQAERAIGGDPDGRFDAIGNVTALSGGEIDPALSAEAGQMMTIAPVPADPARRGDLAAYAAAANAPRVYALGRDATLAPANNVWKGEAVLAGPLGETLAGTLSVSVEDSHDRSLGGPAAAALVLPASNPFSPFSRTVILNRYLTETDPLLQLEAKTTLNAGAVVRGAVAGWQWDFTASLNQLSTRGFSERGIDFTAANAAIAAGADPFAPLAGELVAARQIDRSRQRSRTLDAKLVATGTPLRLPAGPMTVSASVEGARMNADSSLEGGAPFSLRLARSRIEGGLTASVPLTSRSAQVLPDAGDLSLNGSANLRRVQGFGTLRDTTLGLAWSPIEGVQLLANRKVSEAAPDLVQQSTPPRQIENVPIFDFASGRTEIVTLFLGGNPDLRAERRRTTSLSLSVKPLAKSQLLIGVAYEDATILDQTGTIFANTAQTEALVPELFGRDAAGRLISVTFRPINFAREHRRQLQLSLTASGRIGAPPAVPSASETGKPADPRPTFYAGIVPTIAFEDSLQLRPGTVALDLLNGDSVGTYTPRLAGYAYGGINKAGYGANVSAYYGGARRTRSDIPASDLRFAAFFKLGLAAYLPVRSLTPRAAWADRLQLRLDVENLLDSRQQVRNGSGNVPYRYQTDLIDPLGRTVTISLRKRF